MWDNEKRTTPKFWAGATIRVRLPLNEMGSLQEEQFPEKDQEFSSECDKLEMSIRHPHGDREVLTTM